MTALAGCGSNVPLPPPPQDAAVYRHAQQAFVDAMKPRRDGRPVVAVVALNEGTEMTDFLLPHAVLQRSGVVEVRAVAPRAGRVSLFPALAVDGVGSLDSFDQAHPAGADYVIVPAMVRDDDATIAEWLRRQATLGARVIAVCAGGRVLGHAGLLDGRRFTGHWFDRDTLAARPGTIYVPHQRYVADQGVATTTGITASVPVSLALVEAIGGRAKATALAAELGVADWSPSHDSSPFRLTARLRVDFVLNKLRFRGHEAWQVEALPGTDDVRLALAADAWSRTGRVRLAATSDTGPVTLRSGLLLVTEPPSAAAFRWRLAPEPSPMQTLDRALCAVAARHGAARRDWVMLEMEYSSPLSECGV